MKILFVTHGTINFEEKRNFYDSFIEMGHETCYFNYIENYFYFNELDVGSKFDNPNSELLSLVITWKPDLIFSILNKDQIEHQTFKTLRSMGFKIINWFCDDHWRFEDYTRHWLPYIDYAVTTDPNAVDKYKAEGFENIIYSTWAANPKHYIKQNLVEIYDVVFVGSKYGIRQEILGKISNAGINLKVFGRGFGGGRLSFDDYINVINQGKIHINIATCSQGNIPQMKAKNFEIPCCGGFLLTEYFPEVEIYYEEHEMAYWNDVDDLIDKIKYWSNHSNEREDRARLARDRVLKEHTYVHRFGKIFNQIMEDSQ